LSLSLTDSATDVWQAITKLVQILGTTSIGSGLTVGQQDIVSFGRKNVPHAILLITNDNWNDGPDPDPIAQAIKKANTTIFVLAIGEVYLPPVAALASSPDDVFVSNFGPTLDAPLFDISSSICGQTGPCDGQIDVELVLDGSGSIVPADWQLLLNFSRNLVSSFTVSPSKSRFGIVQFSDDAKQELALSSDKNEIQKILQNLKQMAGSTYLGRGIDVAQSDISAKGRSNTPHAMIILTDGDSSGDPIGAATRAKNAGTIIFCIGVGSINLAQLNAVGSLPTTSHVFIATNFGSLQAVQEQIIDASCPN